MAIYRPKTVDLQWDTILDVDVEGVLEGRVKLTKDLVLHVCQAKVETDQPEAGDLFSLIQLWRVMQVLLETTLYESSAYAHKSLGLEQHRKSYSEETDAKLKTLAEELERVKHENAVLKGEKFGIVEAPVQEAKGPLLSEEEGKALQEKVRKIQEQYTTMMKQKTALAEELQQLKDLAAKDDKAAQLRALSAEVKDLNARLEAKDKELEAANKVAEGKVNDAPQFKNMKAMLAQKNELLRDVRDRLRKYEVEPPGPAEED